MRYQGDAIAQELTGSSVTRTFVTDEAGRVVKFCDPDCSGSNPQYLVTWNGHGDAVGIWLINGDGTLTRKQSMAYDTWGAPTIRDGSGTVLAWDDTASLRFRYLYVGAYGVAWDELGIGLKAHHMGARHYSPALGRFLQPDPSAQEMNLYAYAENGPISNVDPDGLRSGPWYLIRRQYINQKIKDAIFLGFALRNLCRFLPVKADLCWLGSVGVQNASGQSVWLVRESWYSVKGYARLRYFGAVRSGSRWLYLKGHFRVTYRTEMGAKQARRCAEVLAGYRSPYALDWYCGQPISIAYIP